eukprot:CAMPEP_0170406620 /NCGR_PEP_ID=MMETSP0117_2-20130122/27817_1 /TAXON_ID=400756 /ORGANISM="Durinskia baltica, Strain CSIRO CS-38" /LENGTH=210 /DNA_ID=CAMNT_0010663825 /DNA_START=106 /DNA_END=736 /DNA_ORIENTATION=-
MGGSMWWNQVFGVTSPRLARGLAAQANTPDAWTRYTRPDHKHMLVKARLLNRGFATTPYCQKLEAPSENIPARGFKGEFRERAMHGPTHANDAHSHGCSARCLVTMASLNWLRFHALPAFARQIRRGPRPGFSGAAIELAAAARRRSSALASSASGCSELSVDCGHRQVKPHRLHRLRRDTMRRIMGVKAHGAAQGIHRHRGHWRRRESH